MEIRLFKPSIGKEELENIKDTFDTAWMGLGPKVSEFEREWTKYIGSATSVAVNSGTAALHLALAAFGFKPGAKVLVTGLTFVASATCILYNRLDPVFVDVDYETLSMSLTDMERKVTKDCVAIIVVHFAGHPAPMDKIMDFARTYKLKVIEDCAHCAGGEYLGKKLGTWSDIGCFSFEEKKAMTTGDGGMIVSHDPDLIEPLRARRWVGIDKDTWKRVAGYTKTGGADPRHWYYEVADLGYKYNMNDLAAAIGLAQLKKLDQMNCNKARLIGAYLEGIRELACVQPLLPYNLEKSSYWIFGIRCPDRDKFILHLKRSNIATGVHYLPLQQHPLFSQYHYDTPIIDEVWPSILTLPLFADMTMIELNYVVESLKQCAQNDMV
ncbi:MAG: DegT/DnrJ/EryC1/StrS family aminotransferase [Deltaproteobacteria bacterium]|nr:DegT/DnrJ/EryC1/StrS family aminotransferase [Deltaproteobacteria bacterium]